MSATGSGSRRSALIAGNWKMYKTAAEARAWVRELSGLLSGGPLASAVEGSPPRVELALCAPFTALHAAAEEAAGQPIAVLAQNMHQADEGAFTGEVSAPMLKEAGVAGVLLGHSERREHFGESDRALAQKVPAALAAGLTAVLCVGESEQQRDAGDMERTLRHQVGEDLAGVADSDLARIVIAYEPIWAIGTGNAASAEQAQEACGFIRALIATRSSAAAERVRVIYGGSVKPDNAAEVLACEDIDGALIGGASLAAASFLAIAAAAI